MRIRLIALLIVSGSTLLPPLAWAQSAGSIAGVVRDATGAVLPEVTVEAAKKSGRKIFQTRCAMCHVGQDPGTELAPDAPRSPRTLGPLLSKAQATNETTLRAKISNGGPRMPGYKYTFTDEQIDQVVAFLKTVERPLTMLATARPGE